jgi:hypothetical protein
LEIRLPRFEKAKKKEIMVKLEYLAQTRGGYTAKAKSWGSESLVAIKKLGGELWLLA